MTAQPAAPHRRAERPPLRDPFLALLVVALVIAVLETLVVEDPSWVVRTLYGIGGAAVVTAVFFRAVAEQRRRATARARAALARHEEASAVLAEQVLPALLERLRDGDSAETALAACPSPDDASHRSVLRQVAEEVGRAEAARAATTAAGANAAGRMQALATSMLADLREMEHRHGGEDVLADLLHLDHRTAQAGRIADSIAVLTGARSGRRWAKPIVMESILRGAMGRIAGYQRVRLHSTSTAAIAGHAAEGVMHALAELMDNATSFSPPTAEVHVYVEEVPSGIVVTVEDSGLVMGEVALRRAEQAVTAEKLDISALSGTRLGLAVVGSLARKHGLTVSYRPSARGGTGVLVRIPQSLVSHPQRDDAAEPPATPSVPAQDLLAGLPSRRASRRTSAGAHPAPLVTRDAPHGAAQDRLHDDGLGPAPSGAGTGE
ncbi:ATP-binding protein, partial [Streptomyces bohaiensis]